MPSSQGPDAAAEARARAERLGLAFLPAVDDAMLVPELVAPLPLAWARSHDVLPLRIDGEPCLLVADPTRVEVHQQAAQVIGCPLRCVWHAGVGRSDVHVPAGPGPPRHPAHPDLLAIEDRRPAPAAS